ncbi:uncharacterized protein N7487_007934 [Penicillium crustosum]|uniref:uncharacterized protein n=1 Tax=Penicillium crustosum TaxID=36656 RepID=UPI002388087D|nr:uncharacterized protein N7487_007934 [Penicillium crustosum]KAJ5402038.1 hypothetical protein N7487_007934 [Penicillium crustosum]
MYWGQREERRRVEQTSSDWRKEIFATTPLMTEMAWASCVKELQDKAFIFRENGHVRVLDTGSTCVDRIRRLWALDGVFAVK